MNHDGVNNKAQRYIHLKNAEVTIIKLQDRLEKREKVKNYSTYILLMASI